MDHPAKERILIHFRRAVDSTPHGYEEYMETMLLALHRHDQSPEWLLARVTKSLQFAFAAGHAAEQVRADEFKAQRSGLDPRYAIFSPRPIEFEFQEQTREPRPSGMIRGAFPLPLVPQNDDKARQVVLVRYRNTDRCNGEIERIAYYDCPHGVAHKRANVVRRLESGDPRSAISFIPWDETAGFTTLEPDRVVDSPHGLAQWASEGSVIS